MKIEIRTPRPVNLHGELIEAIVIVQLGRPLPPSQFNAAEIVELVDNPIAEQQIQIKQLLAPLNRRGLSAQALSVLSARIHLRCEWALLHRQSSSMNVSRSNRRARAIDWTPAGPLKRELRGVVRAANGESLIAFAKTIAALSPAVFDLLTRRIKPKTTVIEMLAQLLCRGGMKQAAQAALRDKTLDHRPPMSAHDAAVTEICRAYVALTGKRAGRTIRTDTGRPAGGVYELIVGISALHPDLRLVSGAADHRLR
jgi:hypothetical protein